MFKIKINYQNIIEKEKTIINFLAKNSDFFSVLVLIKKPYSQNPPVFNFSDKFTPFLKECLPYRKDWPINFSGQLKHQIMIICDCCRKSRMELMEMPNLFTPIEYNAPEDICFFRNNQPWFATISHEKLAFMLEPKDEDLKFLKKNSIDYY